MKKIFLTLFIVCVLTNAFSQNWNFGLNQTQKNLPKGNAPIVTTVPKARIEKQGILTLDKDNEYIISDGWDMIEAWKTVSKPILEASCDLTDWYNATVPGTVLTTLVDQGIYPDPYIGLNNLQIPDTLCRMNWWYRVKFDLPNEFEQNEYAQLLFNGINYKAQVWFNGRLIGDMIGAFKRGFFDVGHLLKSKNNVLAIQIFPPNNPGIPHEANMENFGPNGGVLSLDGPTFIATEGWDWMPAMKDRSIGIWQDVRLSSGGSVLIENPQVITDLPLPDTTKAAITIKAMLHNKSKVAQTVHLIGEIGNISVENEYQLEAGEQKNITLTPESFPQLVMNNPKLWWPNGYGNQPLYHLKLSTDKGSEKTIRFGIREMSYELMVDVPDKLNSRIDYSPTDIKEKRPLFVFDEKILRDINDIPESEEDKWLNKLEKVDFKTFFNNEEKYVIEDYIRADYNDAHWKSMLIPKWLSGAFQNFDGIIWFRKSFEMTSIEKNARYYLSLGGIDDNDITYLNGVKIGMTQDWTKKRNYIIPAGLLKNGKNTISIQLFDGAGNGGIYGEDLFGIKKENELVTELSGDWNYLPSAILKDNQLHFFTPDLSYENMPSPEVNYPFSSVVLPQLHEGVDISWFNPLESVNPFLFIKVNGVPIFCKGGNWGMDDAMKRVSRSQLEPYFRLNAEQNFNMARNWLGQSTEEVFYDLCDEYGMLVWNDFTISTEGSNLRPLDHKLFLENAEDIVKRFVNHPSIAVWGCGNETFAPHGLEEGFQEIISKYDGTRHYHGQSRFVNMTSSGPWKYTRDYTEYYNNIAFGFNSELGAPSVPTYSTVKKFIPEEDLWPQGDVWSYHDAIVNGWVGWGEYCEDIDAFGEEPCKNAEEFCERAQVLNYNLHRILFESWNDKMWDDTTGTSGVLYWMAHPAWYSVLQQTYSWDYKTFGTFYGIKKSCEPLHIQWNLNDHKVQIINASSKSHKGLNAEFKVYNAKGKSIFSRNKRINITGNEKINAFEMDLPKADESLMMVRLILTDNQGDIVSINDYWCNDKYTNIPIGLNGLKQTRLDIEASLKEKENNTLEVTVTNNGTTIAPYVEMDIICNGESLLPSYFSDSYFNLLPGEHRTITIEVPNLPETEGIKTIVAKALNAKTELTI
jgi:archaellum component FlaF (FlaF/FlaG flagellin family)